MDKNNLVKINDWLWEIPKSLRKDMKVPARIYSSEKMLQSIEESALKQLINITTLPGIVKYAIGMPDIHSGYGPPIGGVGAIDVSQGVISPGFVGFDENCGVRLLKSEYIEKEIRPHLDKLITEIQKKIPSGLGKTRETKLSFKEVDEILEEGVPGLIKKGYGTKNDIENCEEGGKMKGADASCVSERAKSRGRNQVGTLGSGNHFLEIQKVEEVFDNQKAKTFGLFENQIVIMIHTGSRGLGHQNCTDYLKTAGEALKKYQIDIPDREMACMPFNSPEGQRFFKAMCAACNFAWANRQMITFYIREIWEKILGNGSKLELLYDVAHNIAKIEEHEVNEVKKKLIIHRKGATRAFPPGHADVPERYRSVGQPVLIPGSMGTSSFVLAGCAKSKEAWHTVNHGAGRIMSRKQAVRQISGSEVVKELKCKGIIIKSHSMRGIAEEAPIAYKNIDDVIEIVCNAGLAEKVARLVPLAVAKGE